MGDFNHSNTDWINLDLHSEEASFRTREFPTPECTGTNEARVYVLLASQEVQWDFVWTLREEAKDQLKEYAIITIDDDKYNGISEKSQGFRGMHCIHRVCYVNIPGGDGDEKSDRVPGKYHGILNTTENSDRLYHSFRAVLKITPTYPTNKRYKDFEKQVLNRIKQHPFCVPYDHKIFQFIEVPVFAAHLYDAVMIYAQALNQTLADPTVEAANGTHILSLIKNRAFPSIQGFKILHPRMGGTGHGRPVGRSPAGTGPNPHCSAQPQQ
ncbi:hypothetical protein SK128_003436 [Halocaridina rubra]|uniref:Uncharacterized protein n=1 Tax=Halocaridina rubra TaxID=373956 RepID=A0AAN8XHL6_HALRR